MGAYQIVRFIIYSLLDILSLMIVVRALLSFFVMMAGSELLYKVYNVLALITNPILEPVRRLLQKVPALARMPVDFLRCRTAALFLFSGDDFVLWATVRRFLRQFSEQERIFASHILDLVGEVWDGGQPYTGFVI